jgi:hypothetical protein
MVLVAVLAVVLVVVTPLLERLFWLYKAPLSINLISARIDPRWVVLEKRPRVDQPVMIECSYQTGIGSSVPSGLPYRILIDIRLTDSAGTVIRVHQRTFKLISGTQSGMGVRGELSCAMTPRRPGRHTVRYEMHATDLFGRTGSIASHTGGFSAQ